MADVLSDHFLGDSGARRGKEMLGSSILPRVGDLVVEDALLQPLSTVSPSPSSLSGNESVHRDGGMVSEEVRDSPMAREAVRPQPTGVAHMGCCRVEEVPGGGGSVPTAHVGGSFGQECLFPCWLLVIFTLVHCPILPHCRGHPFKVLGELEPPPRLRHEGADDWLGVPSEWCARKQKLGRLLPRSLLEKMKRATADDVEFHVKVECRHSCRLSASLPSIPSDLGFGWENGMCDNPF
ncbi:hypothetical protein Dimus_015955 [Dionaea muscipula]